MSGARQSAALLVEMLLDGPVTEYGVADVLQIKGGDRVAQARAWLAAFNAQGLLEVTGERQNPRRAPKGTHPIYRLKLPQ